MLAQIHAGGRGKAGSVKLVKTNLTLKGSRTDVWKVVNYSQTGPKGKVKRVYIEEASDIETEPTYLVLLTN